MLNNFILFLTKFDAIDMILLLPLNLKHHVDVNIHLQTSRPSVRLALTKFYFSTHLIEGIIIVHTCANVVSNSTSSSQRLILSSIFVTDSYSRTYFKYLIT